MTSSELLSNFETVFKDGFQRAVIKSDENNTFIGVYYITPNGEYLKNTIDVLNWLNLKSGETDLSPSNFNFTPKKIFELCNEEYIIEQQKIPPELKGVLFQNELPSIPKEKNHKTNFKGKRSIVLLDQKEKTISSPNIIINDEVINSEKLTEEEDNSLDAEPKPKQIKLQESGVDEESIQEVTSSIGKDISIINELVVRKPYEFVLPPIIPTNNLSILETVAMCHVDKLMGCVNADQSHDMLKKFRPYCNGDCAFDVEGKPRVAFECDICLILWHTECSGYRWMSFRSMRLIVCDNCYTVQRFTNCAPPNTFCDIEGLFQQESKSTNFANLMDSRLLCKFEPIIRLYNAYWIIRKQQQSGPEIRPNVTNLLPIVNNNNINNPKFISNINIPIAPLKKSLTRLATPTTAAITTSTIKSSLSDAGRCKYSYEVIMSPENIVRELNGEIFHLKYDVNSIETLCKIFSDSECRLSVEGKLIPICGTRIILSKGELTVPLNLNITKPTKAVFFVTENNQELNPKYKARFDEMKTAMVRNYWSKFDVVPPFNDYKAPKQPLPLAPLPAVNETNIIRTTAQFRPIISSTGFNASSIKVLTSNCLVLPIPLIFNSQSSMTTTLPQAMGVTEQTSKKFRQRKQDFSNQITPLRLMQYMKSRIFNLVNLPFCVLQRILCSRNLNTQDKLTCRLVCRTLKGVIDGGQVWEKIVINTSYVTGMENMLAFFRTKSIKKLTFIIDFQESFGMDFLLSFICRLKLFPENLLVEKLSIKFTGSVVMKSPCQLCVQDFLSCCKTVKTLSIHSESPMTLTISKKKLSSSSIEILKLKNMENIGEIVQTLGDSTPNLKTLHSGDWSLVTTVESLSLSQITNLNLYFSQSVVLKNGILFSNLVNLEKLSISQPVIDDELISFIYCIIRSKRLRSFALRTYVLVKDAYKMCYKLCSVLPKDIEEICWDIKMEDVVNSDQMAKTLVKELHSLLYKNVHLRVL